MTFHHTAKFKGIKHTFHGEVNFPRGREKDIEANKELIIKGCKNQLVKDCQRWGCEPKDMVFYEIYWVNRIFDDNGNGIEAKEMEVFKWEK